MAPPAPSSSAAPTSAAPPAALARAIRPDERIALFIDGANVHGAARALGFDMDYRRLLEAFRACGRFVRASYYTALIEDQEFSPIRPLVDWLDYNGFKVVTKPARDYTDATGRRRWKGDMDVDIAVDVMEAVPGVDHVVLFSGDGDFVPLVEAAQRRGARVTVVSTVRTSPPMASDELRRAADTFLDLADLSDVFGRPPRGDAP
ncbi:MAG: NYN domain-containing protein [Alphaproteobacteria bacterium]|nr:NYN domain-containing protein [Alphaproteobacteria bacterium]